MFDMQCGDVAHRIYCCSFSSEKTCVLSCFNARVMIILNTEATEICVAKKQCNYTRRYTCSACTKNDTPCKGVHFVWKHFK